MVPPVIAYGTRATATRCWHFAVQSTTVHWIRCLCGINNGNVAHKNHLMLPPCRTALLISICYKCIDIKSSMIEYMEIAHDRFIIYMKEAINKSGIFSLIKTYEYCSDYGARYGYKNDIESLRMELYGIIREYEIFAQKIDSGAYRGKSGDRKHQNSMSIYDFGVPTAP